MQERLEKAWLARELTKGRTHLMAGTAAIRLEDPVTMADHAAKIGADSILAGSPPYSVPTERENALNAPAIDRAAHLPIMLYNYPGRIGINMGREFLDRVAAHIVNVAFRNTGEYCSATSRLIVQKGVKDALLDRIKAHAREWPMGDPLDPTNRIGALVSRAHFDKVTSYVSKGAKVLLGGRAEGGFVEPTILDVSDREARQVREEIFGPVLSVLTVDSTDEALILANDTNYGLAASICTANVKKAILGARAIRAGTVTVNSFGEGDVSTSFGGFKASGFGGRDNGIHAHDQYTQTKTMWIDLADDADEAVN